MADQDGAMGLVWITGVSGAGKSTVRERLVKLGYEAHDTDADDFRQWRRKTTGADVDPPDGWPSRRPSQAFLDEHTYPLRRDRVEHLHAAARGRTIFLCGTVE